MQNSKVIYLVFKSHKNLTMFNFRMDKIRTNKNTAKSALNSNFRSESLIVASIATIVEDAFEKGDSIRKLRRLRSARRIKTV